MGRRWRGHSAPRREAPEPGSYALEVDDPRNLPRSRAGVATGESVDAQLEGSPALALNVVDAQGNALTDYSVRVEFRNVSFAPSEFESEPVRGPLELRGAAEVDGLVAGETCQDPGTWRGSAAVNFDQFGS